GPSFHDGSGSVWAIAKPNDPKRPIISAAANTVRRPTGTEHTLSDMRVPPRSYFFARTTGRERTESMPLSAIGQAAFDQMTARPTTRRRGHWPNLAQRRRKPSRSPTSHPINQHANIDDEAESAPTTHLTRHA